LVRSIRFQHTYYLTREKQINTPTLEEDKSLSLDIWGVRNFEFAVQSGLSSNIVIGDQDAYDNFVGSVLQTVDIDAGMNQRVTPEKIKKKYRMKFYQAPINQKHIYNACLKLDRRCCHLFNVI